MSLEEIQQSAKNDELIVILGAGASIALTPDSKRAKTWNGLISSGLEYCRKKGLIETRQQERFTTLLESNDIDELMAAAEFVSRKLDSPNGVSYSRWLQEEFEGLSAENQGMINAVRAINSRGVRIATLNYDTILEDALSIDCAKCTDLRSVKTWNDNKNSSVLHLHGVWNDPESCVFGIRDYQDAVTDDFRHLIQASLCSMNRILFVGCGDTFSDPNFSNLISWISANVGGQAPQHYALVKDSEVQGKLADPQWRNFVEPVGYGEEFGDLPGFLLSCFPTQIAAQEKTTKAKASAAKSARAIAHYRNFLLEDCGEMAIEGMRADLETARRKFDLEKLFVPLEVRSVPPEISLEDPTREAQIRQWQEENPKQSFGEAFTNVRKMALLALPGGGKTLLLKRLAVAYSDENRRKMSSDSLPDEDLVPILIRCREWKEHIRLPIKSMLGELPKVTGEQSLSGFLESIDKQLKNGTVLLLVDGLDEIHDDADRTIFAENLEKFVGKYPKIRLVVTSREAGFDLVAPCLVRFCQKLRISPLSEAAIRSLTDHWHLLMGGGSPDSIAEGKQVADDILRSPQVRGLAENPLLLTMLLVVKHGAGRLPPDRVTLYERAVEVLLDTWNIQGHAPLNIKEAVPQLACLAYELMLKGKQTAIESEILAILDLAREKLPLIGRYAKDSSSEFLRRVELRSSLVVEGGHTEKDGQAVPFYQFRHLTFQEYLAALASVEGYVLDDEARGSVLSALEKHLESDEWKEIIPMAAVLAKSQARDLIKKLIEIGEKEKTSKKAQKDFQTLAKSPSAVGLLAQAMAEEAVIPSADIDKAAYLVSYFGTGVRRDEDWRGLAIGPYGDDLRAVALEQFLAEDSLDRASARLVVSLLEAMVEEEGYWADDESAEKVAEGIASDDLRISCKSILKVAGGFWVYRDTATSFLSKEIYDVVESKIYDDSPHLIYSATWLWGFWRHLNSSVKGASLPEVEARLFTRLIELFTTGVDDEEFSIAFLAGELMDVGYRRYGADEFQQYEDKLRNLFRRAIRKGSTISDKDFAFLLRVIYSIDGIFKEDEIKRLIKSRKLPVYQRARIRDIFEKFDLDFD